MLYKGEVIKSKKYNDVIKVKIAYLDTEADGTPYVDHISLIKASDLAVDLLNGDLTLHTSILELGIHS